MCLKQLADDERAEFPIAAKIVKNDFYMDDVLSGADELHDALECQEQLISLLNRGGFQLHKWCANAPQLLQKIPETYREIQVPIEDRSSNEVIKTLGLLWDPHNDVFLFSIRVNHEDRDYHTIRTVLSDTAKIYDPLGFLGPVTIRAKVFIQELWANNVNWDEHLTEEQETRWRQFKDELQNINEVRISRRSIGDKSVAFEIHGFSDASKRAYGACVYLRSLKADNTSEMHLLSSKTRVAPLPKKPGSKRGSKPFTIPRAELCGALLLAKLVTTMIESMKLQLNAVTLWCDSQIVLCWLNKSPANLEVFVGNKVREINQLTAHYKWQYINSKENPADLASRGVNALELMKSALWWHGPSTIQNTSDINSQSELVHTSVEELRDSVHANVSLQDCPNELLTRYSDFRKLQRVFAYAIRFINNSRAKDKTQRVLGSLTVAELRQATQNIIAQTQKEGFSDELKLLRRGRAKMLLPLAPFIDQHGMLRVGGRLRHARIPFGKKHQLLLPRSHHVTKILIMSLHKEHLHVGPQALLSIVRQRYWPVRAKSVIRQVIKKCVQCFRMHPPEVVQFMGELPAFRVNPSLPFSTTGVDYAGPFFIRQGVRRMAKVKAYVALFICMSTKAIHLELVSDLTSEAFLAAPQRFVGRRGYPEQILSDNATNFRGAQSQLHELYLLFSSQQANDAINHFCTAREIQWSFIPPRSPNFGGIWEAGVKAAKSHLKIILRDASLKYEEINTVLVQIEAVLNSRPLTQLSADVNDLSALTPGHFLVGRELVAVPDPNFKEIRLSSLSRWQHLQKLKHDFWIRWSSEYLHELQPRSKWYKNKLILQPGMLIVLKEDNVAPQQWRMGRIKEICPGIDGLVRAVKVKTSTGEVCRGVSKISVLPIEDNEVPENE
ncbi:uncharacterized protein LOC131680706 [Topomyia yanbarensis]|uniref:uncharacterized protein LOC131680706 n=1 Tax=Topomyia yanbarensis TaxID=2498891 RepID=UPI00273C4D1E|nr:uncharacterized protein LOC131680706 [Topomyia yanbarensis]